MKVTIAVHVWTMDDETEHEMVGLLRLALMTARTKGVLINETAVGEILEVE
jgi:hypothetical protein